MTERNEWPSEMKNKFALLSSNRQTTSPHKLKYNTGEFVIIHSVNSFRLSLITVRFNHVIATLRAVERQIRTLYMLTYTV